MLYICLLSVLVSILTIIVIVLHKKLIYRLGWNKQQYLIYKQYCQIVKQSKYILHALGGMEGYSYINSIEALNFHYKNGKRLFEVDISYTQDNILVLSHGWKKKDFVERLGVPYNSGSPIPTFEQFKRYKIQGRYTPSSLKDLMNFMKEHDDAFFLIDLASKSYETTKKYYEDIVNTAKSIGDYTILQRFIVGGHTTDMLAAINEVYSFALYYLYLAPSKNRERSLYDIKSFMKYCKKKFIVNVSMSKETFLDEEVHRYIDPNLNYYIFTLNKQIEANKILSYGEFILGTDFLS